MTTGECARRLFKKNWADQREYTEALNAYKRMSADKQIEVERIGQQYK